MECAPQDLASRRGGENPRIGSKVRRRRTGRALRQSSARDQCPTRIEERECVIGGEASEQVRDMVASFQKAAVDQLVGRTVRACRREGVKELIVAGGVACNSRLRRAFRDIAEREGLRVHVPAPCYTTDNAAMIAAAGFLHLERGERAGWDLNADPNLSL